MMRIETGFQLLRLPGLRCLKIGCPQHRIFKFWGWAKAAMLTICHPRIRKGAAVAALFGQKTPASSTKGFTGHTLGAAGITEIAIAALALQRGMIPGSLNTQTLDPEIAINYQLNNAQSNMRYAMSNSFGFGGSNCSVVLGNGKDTEKHEDEIDESGKPTP